MSRKPTTRRSFKEDNMELNLTPMMNLIGILIPVLLVSTAFIEMAVIDVLAPALSGSDEVTAQPDEPPLNLRLIITSGGYSLSGSGFEPITIPVVQKRVLCSQFLGTVPPPRAKNVDAARCKDPKDERTFWVYDQEALTRTLAAIKEAHPDESTLILEGEPSTEYESMTQAMDSSRDTKDSSGEYVPLFGNIIIGGGQDA